MRIDELQDGQVVRARWGRAGADDVNWGPWSDVALHIQRTKLSRKRPEQIVCLTLRDKAWADYQPSDLSNGVLVAEDYYLEIEGLTP